MRHAFISAGIWIFACSLPLQSHAAALPPSTCELLLERLEKYDEILNELVFLYYDFVASDQAFQQFHRLKVSNEIHGGELERISEAKEEIERLCR
jgi:hypothetical protein